MLVIKSVPIQERPLRLTCSITRFRFTEFPGWRIVRMRGKFWQFPPVPPACVPTELIERSFDDEKFMRPMRKNMALNNSETARSTQAPGAYWSGQSGCVNPRYKVSYLQTHMVTFTHRNVEFRGMLVKCVADGKPTSYLMVTDKLVDVATFRKYLFFYPQHISKHVIAGDRNMFTYMPYRIDQRLEGCSEDQMMFDANF